MIAALCSLAIAPPLAQTLVEPAEIMCAALLAVAAMLAVRLRSLRVFLGLISLGASLAALTLMEIPAALHPFCTVLIAIDFAFLLLVDDAFFDWLAVAWWSGLLFVQWAVFLAAVRWDASFFHSELANRINLEVFSFGIVELMFVSAGLALLGRFLFAADAVGSGLLWGLLALAPGVRGSHTSVACIALSGIVLALAAIERSHWIAYHDELTGLPGRRAFNEALAALGENYAIAIVDVDHFKKFNDTFGHETGDQVLRKVAAQLAHVGGGGRAFRCGGEEFAIVFAESDLDNAFDHAEDVRLNIEEDGFIARGPARSQRKRPDRRERPKRAMHQRAVVTSVTVSIGIAEADDRSQPEDVVEAADKALYRAKHNGRNRVERALTPPPRAPKRAPARNELPVIR